MFDLEVGLPADILYKLVSEIYRVYLTVKDNFSAVVVAKYNARVFIYNYLGLGARSICLLYSQHHKPRN